MNNNDDEAQQTLVINPLQICENTTK